MPRGDKTGPRGAGPKTGQKGGNPAPRRGTGPRSQETRPARRGR